jgi:hypothetical protein
VAGSFILVASPRAAQAPRRVAASFDRERGGREAPLWRNFQSAHHTTSVQRPSLLATYRNLGLGRP